MGKKKRRQKRTGSMMRKFMERLSANAELKKHVARNVSKNLERQRRRDARDYHYNGDDYSYEKGEVFSSADGDGNCLREVAAERHAKRDSSVWVVPGDTVRIGRYTIRGGFFYLGCSLLCPDLGYHVDEPSLIDPELKYIRRNEGREPCICCTGSHRYGYRDLGLYEKAAYLEWLAGGRDDPEYCPGYVYIYFCGIERRLLVDNRRGRVPRAEFVLLVKELKRLETVYGDCLEEVGIRVNDLLSHVIISNKHGNDGLVDTHLVNANLHLPGLFKFPLALGAAMGQPLRSEVALAWVKSHSDYTPEARLRQHEEEFDALFRLGYREMFGEGLKIKCPSAMEDLSVSHDPVNFSLCEIKATFNLPDASGLKTPFRKLKRLAEVCMDEIFSLDGSASHKSGKKISPEAGLPPWDDIPAGGSLPALDRIKTAMKNSVSGSAELVPVRSLLGYEAESPSRQISQKQALMISETAQGEGLSIAPDIRFHDARPYTDGNLVLLPGGTGKSFTPSDAFRKMVVALRLGSMILSGEENMKSPGTDLLRAEIDGNAMLTEAEKHSLHAYLLWRIQAPRSESGLKNHINRNLNAEEKSAAGHLAIRTAAAAGALSPSTIRRIENIYGLLGLEKCAVSVDIHNQLSPERTLTLADAASYARQGAQSPRGLDSDLINAYEEETRSVRAVLENVFEDERNAEDLAVDGAMSPPASPPGAVSGLDEKNRLLYERLVARRQWSCEEVRKICSDMELMVDGSIETINDWAFENAGAPLIEVGNRVFVDQEIAEAINAL